MRPLATIGFWLTLVLLVGAAAPAAANFGTGVEQGDGDVGETLVTQNAPDAFVYIDADNDNQVDKDTEPIYLNTDTDEVRQAIHLANDDEAEAGTPVGQSMRGLDVASLGENLGFVGGNTFQVGDTIVADHRGDGSTVDPLDVLVSGPEAGTVAAGDSDFISEPHETYDGRIAYIDETDTQRFSANDDFVYFDTDRNGKVSANDVRLFAREHPGQTQQPDADDDGIPDDEDNCPTTANEDQTDTDDDGEGDACDDTPEGEPADADGDGVADENDNCPNTSNADQADADGDGEGDACDSTPQGPDHDGDGTPDSEDNCPGTPNADQQDTDGDGEGDACDSTPQGPPDSDDDGVVDDEDNCLKTENPDQTDTDGDGIGDACDGDLDGDSLTNARERGLGTDPRNPDTDGDGVRDDNDNCPTTENPDQADENDDGTGDACTEAAGEGNGTPGVPAVAVLAVLAVTVLATRRRD